MGRNKLGKKSRPILKTSNFNSRAAAPNNLGRIYMPRAEKLMKSKMTIRLSKMQRMTQIMKQLNRRRQD